jgi:hypothetical protein
MKNDSDDLILQTRRQLDDIENEKKKSREMIEENRIKKAKQMTLKEQQQLLKAKFHAIQKL